MSTTSITPRLLLSTQEVARALGVSERHVKNLVYSGALLSITVGRLRRIYIGDLHAYIDERREVAAHDAASRTGGHEGVSGLRPVRRPRTDRASAALSSQC